MTNYKNSISEWYDRTLSDGKQVRALRKIGDFMSLVETLNPENGAVRLLQLRQDSVVIIPILRSRDKVFTILGDEYRDGAAEKLLTFPAGSLKPGSDIVEEAKREVVEETPIQAEWISSGWVIDVGHRNYSTPGGTNEQIYFVVIEATLPEHVELEDLDGVVSGLEEEHESIKAVVTELNEQLLFKLGSESSKLGLLLALRELSNRDMV